MKFEFLPHGKAGIPVIPLIPDYRLSTIEGRNGIGKTLAARILELISGVQPFTALPKAWESFSRDLGQLTVTIEELPGGKVVRCELNSADWAGRLEKDVVTNPGAVYIDGQAADWGDVRKLIQVRRIAGDEGLTETLARTLREESVYARRRDDETSRVVSALGEELSLLTDDLLQVRSRGHADDVELYRQATAKLAAASEAAEESNNAHDAVVEQLARHREIEASLERLPDLLTKYAAALDAHRLAEEAVASADATLTETGRKQVLDASKAKQIRWLVERLPHRMRHLANAQVEEQRAHARLGVAVRLPQAEVRSRSRAIDREVLVLQEENKSAYLAGTVREAQTTIERELRSMPKRAQDEKIAVVGREIRVHELADGIAVRRRQLEGVPKPDEVADREKAIARLQSQRMWLGALAEIYKKTDQKQKLVDDGTAELAELRGDADGGDAMAEANRAAASARSELLIASVRVRECQAEVDQTLGTETALEETASADAPVEVVDDDPDADDTELPVPITAEQLADQVIAWLEAASNVIDDRLQAAWKAAAGKRPMATRIDAARQVVVSLLGMLAAEVEEAETRRNDSAAALSVAIHAQEHAEEAVGNRLERLGMAVRALNEQTAWIPYRDALEAVVKKFGVTWKQFHDLATSPPVLADLLAEGGGRGAAIESATGAVETVAEIAAEVESAAARVRDQWSNAANYLYKFSGDLSARLEDHPFDARSMRASAGDVLTKWAEGSISALLSTPELRAELFDDSAVVTFNIRDLTVSWTERKSKRRRRRPLEAFSSGEQVFAYTKAKLELLRSVHSEADQVVVFLDEFGAFVARDRFAQLVTYIHHDALGTIADQIVVTVPLSGDLEQVRDNANLANLGAVVIDPPGYVVIPARVD